MRTIIIDLDGTLLHTDKTISEYTVTVLNKCRKHGIPIMAATARPMRFLTKYNEAFLFDAITALNGAVISFPGKKLEFAIHAKSGEKILTELLRYPDTAISMETSKGLYANRDIPAWKAVYYDKFPTLPEGIELYKILASGGEVFKPQCIDAVLTDDVYCTIAGDSLIQIMSRKATKWNGIRHMLAHYGIASEEAVYFGNDTDDIEPIKNCGQGIAVSNAIPSVLAVADKVIDSNDSDGVAKYIESEFL